MHHLSLWNHFMYLERMSCQCLAVTDICLPTQKGRFGAPALSTRSANQFVWVSAQLWTNSFCIKRDTSVMRIRTISSHPNANKITIKECVAQLWKSFQKRLSFSLDSLRYYKSESIQIFFDQCHWFQFKDAETFVHLWMHRGCIIIFKWWHCWWFTNRYN